jgi:uncharacterized protein YjbJ (UPF0337 family)
MTMHKDRVEGAGKRLKGSVKEVIGKVTGDKRREFEGKAEKATGAVQGEAGKTKDAVRDAVEK